eukprot:2021874-Prorocentrum_lima.AAC.1
MTSGQHVTEIRNDNTLHRTTDHNMWYARFIHMLPHRPTPPPMPRGKWEDDGGFQEAALGTNWNWEDWDTTITPLRETAWFHQKRKKRQNDDI